MAKNILLNHSLPNGEQVTIRPAKSGDARSMTAYMKEILHSSPHLILTPSEYHGSVRRTRRWIKYMARSRHDIALIAEYRGTVIGMIDTSTDRRQRMRHITRFGITVHPHWQSNGIGKALIGAILDWAERHAFVEKVVLHVHADNGRARALYERLGFRLEAVLKNAIRYEDGRYVDDILMAKYVKPFQEDKILEASKRLIV